MSSTAAPFFNTPPAPHMPWLNQIPPWFFPYMQLHQKPMTTCSNWPKFGQKSDVYVFYLKLSTIIDSNDWGSGALISAKETTAELVHLLSQLFQGLLSCLEDELLLPFINNLKYANKGIEMLQE
eukprot:6075389-Ditylum_brightwellii.AAC.1